MVEALLGAGFPLPLDRPFSYRQAIAAGLGRRRLAALTEQGLLRRPLRGVYVATQAPDTQLLRAQAMKLVVPTGFIVTDESAGWLAGASMILRPGAHLEPPPLTIFGTGGSDRLRNELVSSGTRQLLRHDLISVHGVLATTPLRTALDLGRLRHRDRAIAALDQMLRLEAFSREELLAEVERFKGMRGVRQLRALAPLANGRSESPGESVLRLRCHDEGLDPEPQVEIFDARGRFLGRVDLVIEELRLILEYFGEEWHDDEDEEHDEARLARLASAHYTVRVFRAGDVFGQKRRVYEQLIRAVQEARERLPTYLIA